MEDPLPYLKFLLEPTDGPGFPMDDAQNPLGASILPTRLARKNALRTIGFGAPTTSFDADQNECVMVEGHFEFSYRNKVC